MHLYNEEQFDQMSLKHFIKLFFCWGDYIVPGSEASRVYEARKREAVVEMQQMEAEIKARIATYPWTERGT